MTPELNFCLIFGRSWFFLVGKKMFLFFMPPKKLSIMRKCTTNNLVVKWAFWVQVFYKYEIICGVTVNEVPLLLIWGLSFTVRFIRLFLRKTKNASSGQSPIDTRLSPAANHQDVLGGVPLQTRSQCSSRAIKVYEKSWEKSLCVIY